MLVVSSGPLSQARRFCLSTPGTSKVCLVVGGRDDREDSFGNRGGSFAK